MQAGAVVVHDALLNLMARTHSSNSWLIISKADGLTFLSCRKGPFANQLEARIPIMICRSGRPIKELKDILPFGSVTPFELSK
jgi:hypothetical protein